MAEAPQLEDYLRTFRQHFESTRMDLGNVESVKDVFSTISSMGMSYVCNNSILLITLDAKNLIIDLILALQTHLHIHTTKLDRRVQLANLASIESSVFADSFDTQSVIPLMEQVVNCGSEERIYSAVSDLAPYAFVASPTPSIEVGSDTQTWASANSSTPNSPCREDEPEHRPMKRARTKYEDADHKYDSSEARGEYDTEAATGSPSTEDSPHEPALKPRTFQYRHLDTTRGEIRLLVLYPARDISIRASCRLIHAFIDDTPDYEALSYVWGSQAGGESISIDGRRLPVTVNLAQALDYLYDRHVPRILWVDAVCINQKNNQEKSQQVQMMTQIYAKARNVVVWLGLFDIVAQDLLHRLDNSEMEPPNGLDRWTINGDRIKGDLSGYKREKRILLSKLAQNEWFQRVWVIQEVAVAREVVVQMGRITISWDEFVTALERCSGSHEMSDVIEAVRTINTIRDAQSQKPYYMDLLVLLERFRHRFATDERDKVFALLGLTSSSLPQEKVVRVTTDYAKSTAEIYTSLARDYVKVRRNLDILCHASLPNYREIPSWVPDWSYCNGLPVLPKCRISGTRLEPMYQCCGNLELDRDLLFSGGLGNNRLWLNGLKFDVVTIVGCVADNPQDLGLEPCAEGISDLLQEWRSLSDICSHVYGANLEEAFQRALVADNMGERRSHANLHAASIRLRPEAGDLSSDNPDYVYLIEGKLGSVETEQRSIRGRLNIEDDRREASIMRAAMKRSFFVTEKGYMGLGPFNTEEGDLVYVLAGGQVPFILRPEISSGGFWLVGESYVHGIMDGEATMLGIEVETIYLV